MALLGLLSTPKSLTRTGSYATVNGQLLAPPPGGTFLMQRPLSEGYYDRSTKESGISSGQAKYLPKRGCNSVSPPLSTPSDVRRYPPSTSSQHCYFASLCKSSSVEHRHFFARRDQDIFTTSTGFSASGMDATTVSWVTAWLPSSISPIIKRTSSTT